MKEDSRIGISIPSPSDPKDVRAFVTRSFTRFFLWMSVTILIGVPLYNFLIETDKNLELGQVYLEVYSVISPIYGLVLGYYFASSSND